MFNPTALKKKLELETLDESELIKPKSYISTGNLAVNKIISGSMFRGIPSNRITTFYGESGCLPATAKVWVLIHADFDSTDILRKMPRSKTIDRYLDTIPFAERVNLLLDIGFGMTEIAKRMGIARQSLYTAYRNNRVAPSKDRKSKSSWTRVNNLIKANIYSTELKNIKMFFDSKHDFLILTPAGFKRCSNLIEKGEKDSIKIETSSGYSTVVSCDHVMQLESGKFDFADNIMADFESGNLKERIRTLLFNDSISSMRRNGTLEMYDIEIDDECHTYYADNIVAHNSGKSLIVSEIIINSLNKENYDAVFYLDSEGGVLHDKLMAGNIDTSKFFHLPVDTVENCMVTLQQIYNDIKSQIDSAGGDESKMPKVLVVLDSLSGLVSSSVLTNAEQGKVVQDMGLEAKLKNKMIKSLMVTVMRTGCPLVVIAHSYANMNAMGPQKFQEMAGGNGIRYASHIVVQSTKSRKRQEDASLGLKGGGSYYSANAIRYITYKNRLVKEGLETTLYVDLNKGISKYAGLWDDAIRHGFIVQQGAWYTVPSYNPDKKYRKDDIADNDDVWNTFLPQLDEKFIKETAYGTGDAPIAAEMENT